MLFDKADTHPAIGLGELLEVRPSLGLRADGFEDVFWISERFLVFSAQGGKATWRLLPAAIIRRARSLFSSDQRNLPSSLQPAGVARHFITPAADSPSVPTRIEWGSPPSDGTSRAGWRQVTLHQADWRKVDREDQTALDAVSPAQVALETGWDFSLPFHIHRLEDNLLGAPPMAAVGENLVACAPAYVPSDDLEQLIFVVSPRSEPMTTGLYWYLHYRRGSGDLSQVIVKLLCYQVSCFAFQVNCFAFLLYPSLDLPYCKKPLGSPLDVAAEVCLLVRNLHTGGTMTKPAFNLPAAGSSHN